MYFEVLCFIFRFLHLRISNKQYPENSAEDIIRNVQTIAELLLEPLITTLLVMDRDILSTITVSNYFVLKVHMLTVIKFWCYFEIHDPQYVSNYLTGKSRELLNGNVGTNEWKELSLSLGQFGDQKSCEKHFVANISPFSRLGWLRGIPKRMVCDEVNSNWKDHAMYNARACKTSRAVLQGCWKLWQPGKIMFQNEELFVH